MKLAALIATLALVCLLCAQSVLPQPQQKPEELARKSAEAWLALTDSGKYAESWGQASTMFQSAVTQQKWVDMVTPVRKPLGKVVSRTLKSATYTKSLPNAPAGEYVVIQFNTDFENKKGSIETITPMLDKDGQWRVSGYYIK
jgi:hypothetical protein